MSRFRVLCALALVLPFGAARAQGDLPGEQLTATQLMNNMVLLVTPDGRVVTRPMRPDHLARMMVGAQPVAAGTIFIERNGHLYMEPDHAMPNGHMLSQHILKEH